jgi:hypothetical protein
VSLSVVRAFFFGLSPPSSCSSPAAGLRLTTVVVVVVVTTAVDGSAERARETLRFRVVVARGDASAAFCERVAGIVVVVVVGGARVGVGGEEEDGVCVVDEFLEGEGVTFDVVRVGPCFGIVAIFTIVKKARARETINNLEEGTLKSRSR